MRSLGLPVVDKSWDGDWFCETFKGNKKVSERKFSIINGETFVERTKRKTHARPNKR